MWISLETLLPHWLSVCCCKTNLFFIHSFTHSSIHPFGWSYPLEVVKQLRYFHLFIHPLEIGIVLSFWSWWKDHCSTTNALLNNEQQHLMVKKRWEKKCKTTITSPTTNPRRKCHHGMKQDCKELHKCFSVIRRHLTQFILSSVFS